MQVYSDATAMHYSTGQGKIASLRFSAALQMLVSLQIHLQRLALHTALQ